MTSALSAALKKPVLDQGASSALADSLKAPQKAATAGGFDLSTIPLPPLAFPGLYHDNDGGEDYVADLDNMALSTSIGTQPAGSFKSRVGTPIVSLSLLGLLLLMIELIEQSSTLCTAQPRVAHCPVLHLCTRLGLLRVTRPCSTTAAQMFQSDVGRRRCYQVSVLPKLVCISMTRVVKGMSHPSFYGVMPPCHNAG